MIGNDIVDLTIASKQSNWQRKGFLNKIFTVNEQEFIKNSNFPNLTVWLLWTMKESAYKVYVQQYQHRFFAPKKIQCEFISKTKGQVKINSEKYNITSVFHSNYIYSTALSSSGGYSSDDFFKMKDISYSEQHKECYKRLKRALSEKYAMPIEKLRIKKNSIGVPKIYQNNKQLKTSFSISHHGNYGMYSILNSAK